MARQTASPPRAATGTRPRGDPAERLRTASFWLACAAIVSQSSVRNLLWGCAAVGAPAATVGFVYQVAVMHQERLQQEFVPKAAEMLSRETPAPDLIDVRVTAPSLVDARPDADLRRALFAMLIARARFVDVHGADPKSITAAVRRAAWAILDEDETMLTELHAESLKDFDTYLFDWRPDEDRLRVLHAQIEVLVPRPVEPRAR